MSKVTLRSLLSKLTVLALSTSAAAPAVASTAVDESRLADDGDGECDADLDPALPIDREHLDPRDAASALGRGLALALQSMRPLAATHLAASWALSDVPLRRLALADALEWTFPLVGDDMILDHLSRDADVEVRVAVARAAQLRTHAASGTDVLPRLAVDPDPEVRAIAARRV